MSENHGILQFFWNTEFKIFQEPFSDLIYLSQKLRYIHFFSDIATDLFTKYNTSFLAIFYKKEDYSFAHHFLTVRARKACLVANKKKFDGYYKTVT